jgi:hypothetical protein
MSLKDRNWPSGSLRRTFRSFTNYNALFERPALISHVSGEDLYEVCLSPGREFQYLAEQGKQKKGMSFVVLLCLHRHYVSLT